MDSPDTYPLPPSEIYALYNYRQADSNAHRLKPIYLQCKRLVNEENLPQYAYYENYTYYVTSDPTPIPMWFIKFETDGVVELGYVDNEKLIIIDGY